VTAPQVSFAAACQPENSDSWKARLLNNARALKLKITSWQPGAGARTLIAVFSFGFEFADAVASQMVQGGFFDTAGSGTVSYTDPFTGQTITRPVTPEGGPGWLDLLATSTRNVERIDATYAGGALAIANTSASTYGPLAAGTYHVANPETGQQYSTTVAVTIPPSSTIGTVAGVVSSFGLIEIVTNAAHGLTTGDVVSVQDVAGITPLASPTAWRVTVLDSIRFTLDGSTFDGAYTSGGTVYSTTLTTVRADVIGTVGNSNNADGVADTNTVTQPITSLVGVTVANPGVYLATDLELNAGLVNRAKGKVTQVSPKGPSGAYAWAALSASQLAPLLGPPRVLASAVTRVLVHADAADGRVYVFCANSSGPISPDDEAVVGAVLRTNVVTATDTTRAVAATNRAVPCVTTVWLPGVYVTQATRAIIQKAIQDYFRTLPVGGESDPGGDYTYVVPRNAIIGVVFAALKRNGIQAEQLDVLLNNDRSNLQLVVNTLTLTAEVAVLTPAVPVVNLVAA
jgi:hypothetical protein